MTMELTKLFTQKQFHKVFNKCQNELQSKNPVILNYYLQSAFHLGKWDTTWLKVKNILENQLTVELVYFDLIKLYSAFYFSKSGDFITARDLVESWIQDQPDEWFNQLLSNDKQLYHYGLDDITYAIDYITYDEFCTEDFKNKLINQLELIKKELAEPKPVDNNVNKFNGLDKKDLKTKPQEESETLIGENTNTDKPLTKTGSKLNLSASSDRLHSKVSQSKDELGIYNSTTNKSNDKLSKNIQLNRINLTHILTLFSSVTFLWVIFQKRNTNTRIGHWISIIERKILATIQMATNRNSF
ncbi:hypothetical protein HDV02_001490 [Globomyces sp. JEL0801]|nr:hypothetical protein HDV02_001490 [Globomyces sp. JEL0801]